MKHSIDLAPVFVVKHLYKLLRTKISHQSKWTEAVHSRQRLRAFSQTHKLTIFFKYEYISISNGVCNCLCRYNSTIPDFK